MTSKRKCRHRDVAPIRWRATITHPIGEIEVVNAEARTCLDCGHWLPLGPSNDEDERVKVEIRGVERAARWTDEGYRPGCDRFDWCPARPDGESLCADCEALCLANCIATHEEE